MADSNPPPESGAQPLTTHHLGIFREMFADQAKLFHDGMLALKQELKRDMDERFDLIELRLDVLELAVRKNSEDIRKHSEDIHLLALATRKNTRAIRRHGRDIRGLDETVERLDGSVERLAAEIAQLRDRLSKIEKAVDDPARERRLVELDARITELENDVRARLPK